MMTYDFFVFRFGHLTISINHKRKVNIFVYHILSASLRMKWVKNRKIKPVKMKKKHANNVNFIIRTHSKNVYL